MLSLWSYTNICFAVSMAVLCGTVLLGGVEPQRGRRIVMRVLIGYAGLEAALCLYALWQRQWLTAALSAVFVLLVYALNRWVRVVHAGLDRLDEAMAARGDLTIVELANGKKFYAHGPAQCSSAPCCIHNPSEHALNEAPYWWRSDLGLMERLCEHGMGHPDPDSLAHIRRAGGDPEGGLGIHACDGCCHAPASLSTVASD